MADTVGGVRFDDPFRWLEDESPDVKAWERAEDEKARSYLRSAPGFHALVDELSEHLDACGVPPPRRAGRKWFSSSFDDGRQRRLYVRDRVDGDERMIVDAHELLMGPNPAIDFYAPAPCGSMVALGVSTRGDEQSLLHVVDSESGNTIGAPAGIVTGGRLAWLPDSTGFYCVLSPGDRASISDALAFVRPGGPCAVIDIPRRCGERRLTVQVSSDGRYVGVGGDPIAPRLLCVFDREEAQWHDGVALEQGVVFWGVFVNDRYVAVTTLGAGRGMLVSAPVGRLRDTTWDVLHDEGTDVLRSVALADGRLLLFHFFQGAARIRVATPEGTIVDEVPLERPGLVSTNPRNPGQYGADAPAFVDAEGLTFSYATVDRAPSVLRYEFASRKLACLAPSTYTVASVATDHRSCRSSDGVLVDYRLVRRASPDVGTCPRPTVIVAYGGWNSMTSSAGYLGALAPFVERGGTVAFANLRGDATHGADQWFGGRRESKQRTFDDLYAVADDLIAEGEATSDMLAVMGGSNGGLLVGVAITQRPELFRAAVALVPLLDMARMLRERFMEIGLTEYGDPRVPSEATWLRSYSPYHNVRLGGTHPATLFVCGASDVRCHPWHARKMVAALNERQPTGPAVMLRVHPDCGHLSAGPLASSEIVAEWLAFIMAELGVDLRATLPERTSWQGGSVTPLE